MSILVIARQVGEARAIGGPNGRAPSRHLPGIGAVGVGEQQPTLGLDQHRGTVRRPDGCIGLGELVRAPVLQVHDGDHLGQRRWVTRHPALDAGDVGYPLAVGEPSRRGSHCRCASLRLWRCWRARAGAPLAASRRCTYQASAVMRPLRRAELLRIKLLDEALAETICVHDIHGREGTAAKDGRPKGDPLPIRRPDWPGAASRLPLIEACDLPQPTVALDDEDLGAGLSALMAARSRVPRRHVWRARSVRGARLPRCSAEADASADADALPSWVGDELGDAR